MGKDIKTISQIKVSVIIPVYNTERYVRDALLSVMNQSLHEIEILVINDGSTDNSLQIIEKIADTDCRIKIYSQTNKGQSIARNFGLEKAQGKYIYMMDSDDLLDREALSLCYRRCEADQLDFVFFDAETLLDDNFQSYYLNYDRSKIINYRLTYSGMDVLDMLIDNNSYRVPPWIFFIKTDLIRQNDICFPPLRIYEDQLFALKIHYFAHKTGYIPKKLFKRRLRSLSLTTRPYSLNNVNTYFNVIDGIKLFAASRNEYTKQIIEKLIRYTLNPAVYMAHTLPIRQRLEVLRKSLKGYKEYISRKHLFILLFPVTIKIKNYLK